MQRISRREFVKRTAVTGAAFTSFPALLAACGESTGANKGSKLDVAAVQGKAKHLYGITIVGNVEMFMYRSDKSSAPNSWDDVLKNAAKYNAANFYGYVIRGKATNPVSSDSLPILWSFGGNVFDDSWKVQLD